MCNLENPVTVNLLIDASEAPATMTSASPNFINLKASPIECAPVVHAVVTLWEGPFNYR
jgi:hypothetical protein